jgi:hypothetical protein
LPHPVFLLKNLTILALQNGKQKETSAVFEDGIRNFYLRRRRLRIECKNDLGTNSREIRNGGRHIGKYFMNFYNSTTNNLHFQDLDLIYHELERGKETGEFLQTKGSSVHGFFKLNLDYIPPEEHQTNEFPAHFDPPTPTQSCEPIQNLMAKIMPRKKFDKRKSLICLNTYICFQDT